MPKKTSTIQQLPPDILAKLQELLRDPRMTQLDVTGQINTLLKAAGYNDQVSKSAVNRYAVRMDKVGERIRQSREVAQMWIGKLGAEPQGEVGKLLNEMVRNLAFDTVMDMQDGTIETSPKMIKELAMAIERLERAASENVKREAEIRAAALKDVTKKVDEATGATGGTMTAERFKQIIKESYGV